MNSHDIHILRKSDEDLKDDAELFVDCVLCRRSNLFRSQSLMDASSPAPTPDFPPRHKPFKEYYFVEKNLPDIEEDHFLVRRHLLRQSKRLGEQARTSLGCGGHPDQFSESVPNPASTLSAPIGSEQIASGRHPPPSSINSDSRGPSENNRGEGFAQNEAATLASANLISVEGSRKADLSLKLENNPDSNNLRIADSLLSAQNMAEDLIHAALNNTNVDKYHNLALDINQMGEENYNSEFLNSRESMDLFKAVEQDTQSPASDILNQINQIPANSTANKELISGCVSPGRADEPVQRPTPIVFADSGQSSGSRDPARQKNLGVVRPTTKIIVPATDDNVEALEGNATESYIANGNRNATPPNSYATSQIARDESPKKQPQRGSITTTSTKFDHKILEVTPLKPTRNIRRSVNFENEVVIFEGDGVETRGHEEEEEEEEICLPFSRSQSMRSPHHLDRWNHRRSSATKAIDINSILLSDKDKKMLHLFILKREKEREEEKIRLQSHKKWEEEKYGNKNKRQSFMIDSPLHNIKEKDVSCNHNTSTDCIASNCNKYYANLDTQQISKKNEIAKNKMYHAMEKKRAVEQRLQEQKEMTSRYLKELKEKHEMELERAALTKKTQHEKQKQKVIQMNKQAQIRQQQLKETRAAKINDIPSQHDCIDAMLSAAEEKAKRRREEDIAKIKSNLQVKIEKSEEKQRLAEEELKKWQQQIAEYRQQQDSHAEQLKIAQIAKKKKVPTATLR